MQKGMSEEEAYKEAEARFKKDAKKKIERAVALQREASKAAKAVGGHEFVDADARPVFLSNPVVYAEMMRWKELLRVEPFKHWPLPPQAALEHWVVTRILGWTDAQLSHVRALDDGTAEVIEEHTWLLMQTLFPETLPAEGVRVLYEPDRHLWNSSFLEWKQKVRAQHVPAARARLAPTRPHAYA